MRVQGAPRGSKTGQKNLSREFQPPVNYSHRILISRKTNVTHSIECFISLHNLVLCQESGRTNKWQQGQCSDYKINTNATSWPGQVDLDYTFFGMNYWFYASYKPYCTKFRNGKTSLCKLHYVRSKVFFWLKTTNSFFVFSSKCRSLRSLHLLVLPVACLDPPIDLVSTIKCVGQLILWKVSKKWQRSWF